MDNIIYISNNNEAQPSELFDKIIDCIDENAVNMDYYAIIGVIEMIKEQIKDDMNE